MTQQSPRVTATIIWAALLAGATMFVGVALYLVFGLRDGVGLAPPLALEPVLIGVSLGLSVVTVAFSWLWAVRMTIREQAGVAPRPGAFPPGPEAYAVTRLIFACALCEGGALFSVVVFLQTGNAVALAPYAFSWLALAAHFPGDRHWAQLTGVPAGAARNPMVRG